MGQIPIGGIPSMSGGSGTYASPDVTQNPGSFPSDSSKVNMAPPVDQDVKSKIDPEQYKKDVDGIKTKVTVDDILQGIEYEKKKQIYKNMMTAKEAVVTNLKKNPRYYRDLLMLGIEGDTEQMKENTQSEKISKVMRETAAQSKPKERTEQQYGDFDKIKKLMDEKWEEKKNKRSYVS